jgi:ABC-type spermidine/putrescine transport system permease subunit I
MKKLLTTIVMLTTTLMVFAQTIEEQAEKAGNEAFAGAMIRNILLIVGGIVIYSVIKSGKTKKEDQQSK